MIKKDSMEYNSYSLFNQDYLLLDGSPSFGGYLSKKPKNQLQQKPKSHTSTTSVTSSGCFFSDSFVDFSELAVNSHLKGQACITTTIIESKSSSRNGRSRKPRSKKNSSKNSQKVATRTRHGISSFQSFNVTSESVMSIRNIMEKQQSIASARASRAANGISSSAYVLKQSSRLIRLDKTAEKENLPKFLKRRGKFRPTILKGRNKGKASKLRSLNQGNSPIKTLTFSPSRFLNTSTLTSNDEITKQQPQNEVVKELSFDELSFDIEDSGIGGGCYANEISEPFLPPSLTSTPISRRRTGNKHSESKPPENSAEHPFIDSDCEDLNWLELIESTAPPPEQGTQEHSSSKDTFISKTSENFYPTAPLNFLDSDTDTTFCDIPSFSFNDDFSTFDPDDLNSIHLYPLDFTPPTKDEDVGKRNLLNEQQHHHNGGENVVKKTARKSLALDEVAIPCEKSFRNISLLPHSPLKSTIPKQPIYLQAVSNTYEQSTLVGDKTMVEKRVFAPGKKPVYLTRPRRQQTSTIMLDQHWVKVACGRSHDQKAMTEAAKRCLTSLRKRHYVK